MCEGHWDTKLVFAWLGRSNGETRSAPSGVSSLLSPHGRISGRPSPRSAGRYALVLASIGLDCTTEAGGSRGQPRNASPISKTGVYPWCGGFGQWRLKFFRKLCIFVQGS